MCPRKRQTRGRKDRKNRLDRREVEDNFLLEVLRLELDKGESEVIVLAKQM